MTKIGPKESRPGGYVTLTIDSFGRRGVKNTCRRAPAFGLDHDPYLGLNYLIKQKLVDPARVAIVGFGGSPALSAVARRSIESESKTFRAAAAFYPDCAAITGPMTVPTLILIGELDDWTTSDACRKLVNGTDDLAIPKGKGAAVRLTSIQACILDLTFQISEHPFSTLGIASNTNESATEQSSDTLREFLGSMTKPPLWPADFAEEINLTSRP